MSIRRLVKDAFHAARDRRREHEYQTSNSPVSAAPFPGQQQQAGWGAPSVVPSTSGYGYDSGSSDHRDLNTQDSGQQYPTQQPLPPPPNTAGRSDTVAMSSAQITGDIFTPLRSSAIPLPQCESHPVGRGCVHSRDGHVSDAHCHSYGAQPANPLQTNAFYGNLLLDDQGCSAWTHPYSLSWAKGNGNARSWGLAISHVDREQLAFGPPKENGASQYYLNPIGIQSVILSAVELTDRTRMTLDSLQAFSANVNLCPYEGAPALVTLPLLQGMGFVTAVYKGGSPLVQSSVFFRDLQPAQVLNEGNTAKYRVTLEDGKVWVMYITRMSSETSLEMVKVDNSAIRGPPGFFGHVQVGKLPAGCSEEWYDRAAGAYAVSCTISASVDGNQGMYNMAFERAGIASPLLMYALPHHAGSFTRSTAAAVTPMRLQTTTKGMAVGVLSDTWQMIETVPADMGFTPWLPGRPAAVPLSPQAIEAIRQAGAAESEQDVMAQCCLDSMYFSGKGLAKFAMMAIALHEMCDAPDLARKVVEKLKQAFNVFVENKQRCELVYEKGWKGVVSRVGMENAGADFGNGYYNDHHFHYGYFVYTAAVLGHLDPSWLQHEPNMAWTTTLLRDFANPVNDEDFPFHRSFDWFHGHSWAKGLFPSADGKDEESTSEDAFASYALKMWGRTVQDPNLEARGNLMLAIQARVFRTYFLMESGNSVQPRQILGNKVTGITFENKCDHATYFGMNPEYVQGIHMIPLAPPSTLIRSQAFVREEWDAYFGGGRVDQVLGGWRGILYANLAIVEPGVAWRFFAQDAFDWAWLDGGASRTWCLAWCAALGGA